MKKCKLGYNHGWTIFSCEPANKEDDDKSLDILLLKEKEKIFIYEKNFDFHLIDGEFDDGCEKHEIYLSKELFEIILNGIKEKEYKECSLDYFE